MPLDRFGRTALVPFWARVSDAQSQEPILGDRAAAAAADAVRRRVGEVEVSETTRLGCCLRDFAIDRWLEQIAAEHHGQPVTIVDIGAGLDTRTDRLAHLNARHVEIDCEPMIRLRNDLLSRRGELRVAADGMDLAGWVERLGDSPAALVLAGVLAYQDARRVLRFFAEARRYLPGSFVLFDSLSPVSAWLGNRPAARAGGRPDYRWATWTTKAIPAGDRRLGIREEHGLLELDRRFTLQFPAAERVMYRLPVLRRAYRLTLAQLPMEGPRHDAFRTASRVEFHA